MVIREVEARDVEEVVALVAATLAEFGLTFGQGSPTDDQVRALPSSYASSGGCFWIARDDDAGALLGCCGVFPVESKTFELRKMYLSPSARGKGVGKALLDVAVRWTKQQGADRMVLDTTEQMTRAIAFYEAHGFVRDDAQIRGARCSRGYTLRLDRAPLLT